MVNNPLKIQYLAKSLDNEAPLRQLARAVGLRNIFILFYPTERIAGDHEDRDQTQRRIGLDPALRLVIVHNKAVWAKCWPT
jgi:hypothetical protein